MELQDLETLLQSSQHKKVNIDGQLNEIKDTVNKSVELLAWISQDPMEQFFLLKWSSDLLDVGLKLADHTNSDISLNSPLTIQHLTVLFHTVSNIESSFDYSDDFDFGALTNSSLFLIQNLDLSNLEETIKTLNELGNSIWFLSYINREIRADSDIPSLHQFFGVIAAKLSISENFDTVMEDLESADLRKILQVFKDQFIEYQKFIESLPSLVHEAMESYSDNLSAFLTDLTYNIIDGENNLSRVFLITQETSTFELAPDDPITKYIELNLITKEHLIPPILITSDPSVSGNPIKFLLIKSIDYFSNGKPFKIDFENYFGLHPDQLHHHIDEPSPYKPFRSDLSGKISVTRMVCYDLSQTMNSEIFSWRERLENVEPKNLIEHIREQAGQQEGSLLLFRLLDCYIKQRAFVHPTKDSSTKYIFITDILEILNDLL